MFQAYDDLNVKLVRPFGDMLGLHSEFLPASKRYMNDYIHYVTSDFLARLGFGAPQQLGETDGIYMGYSIDTGRNVYLQPALASQGVKGSVTKDTHIIQSVKTQRTNKKTGSQKKGRKK